MIDDVFFFNAMSEDEANGVFTLHGDRHHDWLDLDWPERPIGDQPCFKELERIMGKLKGAYS